MRMPHSAPGHPTDGFLHQRAAEVVRAALQDRLTRASPSFTHDTCTLSISPRSRIRAHACIRRLSSNDGPGRAFPARKIGAF
jgi:hypothetical protein